MHCLKELDGRELPKDVCSDVFYARFIHEQDSTSSSLFDLPCSFDTSFSNPRNASGGFKPIRMRYKDE
jgi:hypothetical protein